MKSMTSLRLYHYTTLHAVKEICKTGWLNPSEPNELTPGWIALTTDERCEGHGVHDGREISAEDAEHVRHEVKQGKFYSFDHTLCRIVLDLLSNDPLLIKASDYHHDLILLGLDIAAWHPAMPYVPDVLMHQTKSKLQGGLLERKSPTWWYYQRRIALDDLAGIEIRNQSGIYLPVSV